MLARLPDEALPKRAGACRFRFVGGIARQRGGCGKLAEESAARKTSNRTSAAQPAKTQRRHAACEEQAGRVPSVGVACRGDDRQ